MTISMKYCDKIISNDYNYHFLFKFNITLEFSDEFFAHIINANVETIQVRNVFNKIFIVSKKILINKLQDYNKNDCYLIYFENAYLAMTFLSR